MPNIVGIRFKEAGKIYYFDPGELVFAQGDWAIVETAQGKECGEVMLPQRDVTDDQIVAPLKKVIRKATAEDMKALEERAAKQRHALQVCEEKVRSHNLDMKLVDVEYSLDGGKIVFYFTADGRVDFRALVRDLAAVFRTRIELRQIGVRDEVKMLGGLGPCGREACCKAFLSDFSPVSIRMAKDQNLSLNPTKISGLCGRLMCCLNYEQEHYAETLKRCPRKGSTVLTPEGPAMIDDVLILKEKVKVRLTGDEVEIREYLFDEVKEANQKDIAEWEASGGRARAVTAKAAYKQAQQNKPKKGEQPANDDTAFETIRMVKPDLPDLAVMSKPVPQPQTQTQPDASTEDASEEDGEDDGDDTVDQPNQPGVLAQGEPGAQAPGSGNRRRRRRGGRRRGGFHGGPKA